MTSALIWLLAVIVVGAAAVVAHLALLVGTWRAPEVSARDRWLALVPVLLPWVAVRAGLTLGTAIWASLIVAYVILRLTG